MEQMGCLEPHKLGHQSQRTGSRLLSLCRTCPCVIF